MAAGYSRIHRLLKILTLISGSTCGHWSSKRLAVECGTCERTIYRDLKMLQAAGIPVFFDPESGGYRVRRDFFMPPVQLTFEEALAMSALAEHVGGEEQVPFTAAAARAIAKVRGLLPQWLRDELEQIERHVHIRLAASIRSDATDVYELVRAALSHKRVLRCRYESVTHGGDDEEEFELRPYALFFSQRAWYVVGHHSGRGEIRCLKLARFTRIKLTNQPYSIPQEFTLSKYLGNAWRMIRGAKTYDVELLFDREFADTIAETHWHRTQKITWNDDGSMTFRCRVDGLDEIVWWVLSMGPHCLVLRPPILAEKVRSLARQIVDRYSSTASSKHTLSDLASAQSGLTIPEPDSVV